MTTITKRFMNEFKPSYLRNNRRGGQKNIRCFPTCSADGHKSAGFCGQAVSLVVSIDEASSKNGEDLVAVAEFVQLKETDPKKTKSGKKSKVVPEAKVERSVEVGTLLPREYLDDNVRVKKDPLRRFVLGNKVQDDVVNTDDGNTKYSATFEFLPTCWHYSWRSNKHSTNKQHCLRVYLLQKTSEDALKCVDVYDSPSFSLFSSKQLDNYAKEGKIPNGAMALFNARQKTASEKASNKCKHSCCSKSCCSKSTSKSKKRKAAKAIVAPKTKGFKRVKKVCVKKSPFEKVSFPYDAMIADCLGIERLSWKEESRVLSNGTGANSPNSVKDVSAPMSDVVSMDLFDLSPSTLKHSNSLMAIGDVVDDDFFMFGVEKDLDIDYSSETSESSQGSLLCASGDDESQLWDCCY